LAPAVPASGVLFPMFRRLSPTIIAATA
jgi:hypothetical protein